MNYTIEEKRNILKKVEKLRQKGMSIAEAARTVNVCESTLGDWIKFGINPKPVSEINLDDVANLRNKRCSVPEIAYILGTYPKCIHNIIKRLEISNKKPSASTPSSSLTPLNNDIDAMEVSDNNETVLTKTFHRDASQPPMTPDEILNIFALDPSAWKLGKTKLNVWANGTGCYQSSITVNPIEPGAMSYADIKKFFEENKFIRTEKEEKIKPNKNGYILNIPLADWHYNLLASYSTSGEVYNCEIAEKLLIGGIKRIIQNVKNIPISKISFVTLGDVFHTDNSKQTTTKGTQQQTEKPCNDAFRDVKRIIIKVIDMLVKELNAPLEYIYIHGNHDKDTGDYFAALIEGYYESSKNVTTDCIPHPFKCRMYGDTLVGYHHGDTKAGLLSGLIPNDARELFGKAKRAVMKVGHLHHYEVNARGVVPIEYQPALCGSSAWEKQQGFWSERGIRYTLYSTNSTSCIDGFVSVDDIENN